MIEPEANTVERWAWDYIHSSSLADKLTPPPVPERWESSPPVRSVVHPGRPPEIRVLSKSPKSRGLSTPSGRARALLTFLHHELQAAELMAWAVLRFPSAPPEFRAGLVRIALDEVRHMQLYRGHIERLGHRVGDFPVRDWFWMRVPASETPLAFVATMGLGFESANLEHTLSFATRFREAGDDEGARIQMQVGHEEIAHVRFGARWFKAFSGALEFDAWKDALPPPLSPMLMRGRPLDRNARTRAGFSSEFLDRLDAWQMVEPGS